MDGEEKETRWWKWEKFGVLRFKSTRIGETDGKQEDNYRIV